MENILFYEILSAELKKEVELYHEERVRCGFAHDLQTSTREWFNSNFEKWILSNRMPEAGKKRKNIRLDIQLPLTVAEMLIESDRASSDDLKLIGTVTNISRGGLFFLSQTKYEVSSIIRMKMDFGAVDALFSQIEALAMVIRCDELKEGSYGIGVAFSSIYGDDQDSVSLFIFKQLLAYVRNSGSE